jgi:predicted N-acetyltransferase YhbS
VALSFVAAGPQHVDEMARICYEAFFTVHNGRQSILDFPSLDVARKVLGMLVQRKDFYSVVALADGRVVGSNFLSLTDEVGGVGPITVEPSLYRKGVGRQLMQNVLDYAKRNKIERVRLMQDAHNVHSLSLYASLGFEVREPCALMLPPMSPEAPGGVRLMTESDLPMVEELSRRIYKVSRREEVAAASSYGFSTFVREESDRITGYLMPGIFGHGVAEAEDDAVALVKAAGRLEQPEQLKLVFCPLREHSFFRRLLAEDCVTNKVMDLMTVGPYEPPNEVWMPSVSY